MCFITIAQKVATLPRLPFTMHIPFPDFLLQCTSPSQTSFCNALPPSQTSFYNAHSIPRLPFSMHIPFPDFLLQCTSPSQTSFCNALPPSQTSFYNAHSIPRLPFSMHIPFPDFLLQWMFMEWKSRKLNKFYGTSSSHIIQAILSFMSYILIYF